MSKRAIIEPEGNFNRKFPNWNPVDESYTAGVSGSLLVDRFDTHTGAVSFFITGGGSYTLEGSLDGLYWEAIDAAVGASKIFSFADSPHNHFWKYLRINVLVAGSPGDDVITFAALENTGY